MTWNELQLCPSIGCPFVLIQDSNDSDSGPLVEVLAADVGEFLEGDDLDPAGLLFCRLIRDVEGRNGIAFGWIEDLRIVSEVSG